MPAGSPPCRVCGKPSSARAVRCLCSEHVQKLCANPTCEKWLPPGRRLKYCRDCQRGQVERSFSRPGRLCTECRRNPPTPRGKRCSACEHQVYLFDQELKKRQGPRPCKECGQVMPAGRRRSRCAPCHTKRLTQQNQGKPCSDCQRRQRTKHSSYCRPCAALRMNWRTRYHQGDKNARMLKTMQARRKWQEKEGGAISHKT
jgi:hypothetical protein